MSRNALLAAPPFPVEQALTRMGRQLRKARIRRNLTIAEVAEKIGTGRRAVMDAEKGKPATGMVVYAALLWAYDLLQPLAELADPTTDVRGMMLAAAREPKRARGPVGVSNDF
jgi:transcriptional regulator with XRE-family HTH domain